jgi:plasmid stabilization system protein ParE
MKVEWSDAALADLDRFVEFLNREHPSLAAIVATEIISKAHVLSEHPRLGRPIRGAKNIGRLYCRFFGRRMCFNIATRMIAS